MDYWRYRGSGGIIGHTLRETALFRWFISRTITTSASILNNVSDKRQPSQPQQYYGSQRSKRRRNIQCSYTDPSELQNAPSNLMNFATGATALTDIQDSLLTALDK